LAPKYRLNTRFYKKIVAKGRWATVLELCGYGQDSYSAVMGDPHFKDDRMGLLAAYLHVPYLKLWQKFYPKRKGDGGNASRQN